MFEHDRFHQLLAFNLLGVLMAIVIKEYGTLATIVAAMLVMLLAALFSWKEEPSKKE